MPYALNQWLSNWGPRTTEGHQGIFLKSATAFTCQSIDHELLFKNKGHQYHCRKANTLIGVCYVSLTTTLLQLKKV